MTGSPVGVTAWGCEQLEVIIDEQQQLRGNTGIQRVEHRHQLAHLLAGQCRDTTWSVTMFEHCYALTTPEAQ